MLPTQNMKHVIWTSVIVCLVMSSLPALAQKKQAAKTKLLFRNVQVFNGKTTS